MFRNRKSNNIRVELTKSGIPEPFGIVATVSRGVTVIEALETIDDVYSIGKHMNVYELIDYLETRDVEIHVNDEKVPYDYILDDMAFISLVKREDCCDNECKAKIEPVSFAKFIKDMLIDEQLDGCNTSMFADEDKEEEEEKVEVELIVDKFEELGQLLKRMVDES